jgi:hypothetical protein
MTAMATILINMFLAILNEAYREVHALKDIVPEEYQMLVVFLDYAGLRMRRTFATLKETKLFPTKHKYEIKEHLLTYENEMDQKYTPLDFGDDEKMSKKFDEEDAEDNMISAMKGCFQALRYDLANLMSRSKTYKVHKASKQNDVDDRCRCQALNMKAKSISCSLHNLTDDFRKKQHKDEVKLLNDYEEGYDATQDESDITYSDSDTEMYQGRYPLLAKPDRETNI